MKQLLNGTSVPDLRILKVMKICWFLGVYLDDVVSKNESLVVAYFISRLNPCYNYVIIML